MKAASERSPRGLARSFVTQEIYSDWPGAEIAALGNPPPPPPPSSPLPPPQTFKELIRAENLSKGPCTLRNFMATRSRPRLSPDPGNEMTPFIGLGRVFHAKYGGQQSEVPVRRFWGFWKSARWVMRCYRRFRNFSSDLTFSYSFSGVFFRKVGQNIVNKLRRVCGRFVQPISLPVFNRACRAFLQIYNIFKTRYKWLHVHPYF